TALLPREACPEHCAPRAATTAKHDEAPPAHPIHFPRSPSAAHDRYRDAIIPRLARLRATRGRVERAKTERAPQPPCPPFSTLAQPVPGSCRFYRSSAAQAD